MGIDFDNVVVVNNPAEQRYQAQLGEHIAVIEYQLDGNTITYTHTGVPQPLEGHGVAGKLAHAALEDARARQLTVVPLCPYMSSYIRRHQEYVPLLSPEYRERLTRG